MAVQIIRGDADELVQPEADLEITSGLLDSVAHGQQGPTFRIFSPAPTVAFGRLDARLPGFAAAQELAVARGFTPMVRSAGGHAVVYDGGSVIVQAFNPESRWPASIETRFGELTELATGALGDLGAAVEVGELPDEYCAGRFSVHLKDGPKIAGIAQRIVKGASLTAAVVVVTAGESLRAAVSEIYSALEIPLDPGTVGAIADRHPSVSVERVSEAFARRGLEGEGSPGH